MARIIHPLYEIRIRKFRIVYPYSGLLKIFEYFDTVNMALKKFYLHLLFSEKEHDRNIEIYNMMCIIVTFCKIINGTT